MQEVKRPESRTQQRAAATRARIIRAAYGRFCDRGYRATTMDAIAEAADVAVQTVYFTFGTKDQLLREVHEWTVLGDEPVPPAAQPWHVAAMREPDARRALAKLTGGVATLNARIAPMLPVFAAVSQEPAGKIYEMSKDLRRDGMRTLLDQLRSKTALKRGVTRQRAADLLYFMMGPESYASLVLDLGWTERQWAAWTAGCLAHELFGEE